MKTPAKYDWVKIQEDYDCGLSQRDIIKKYKISSGTLYVATKNGNLGMVP